MRDLKKLFTNEYSFYSENHCIFLQRDRHHVVPPEKKMDFVANSTFRWAGNFEACQERQGMSDQTRRRWPVIVGRKYNLYLVFKPCVLSWLAAEVNYSRLLAVRCLLRFFERSKKCVLPLSIHKRSALISCNGMHLKSRQTKVATTTWGPLISWFYSRFDFLYLNLFKLCIEVFLFSICFQNL